MNVLRNIAVDSFSYGAITIVARLLNYAMIYFHVRWLDTNEYGILSTFYSIIALLNVIYILGLETSFFRFINTTKSNRNEIGNMQLLLFSWSIILSALLLFKADSFAFYLENSTYAPYIRYVAIILFFDAMCSIPFVKLRHQRRTKKYIYLKLLSILINIALQFIFIIIINNERQFVPYNVHYLFIANIGASFFIWLLLLKETTITLSVNFKFLKKVLLYSLPLSLGGLAGMVNDTADRIMIPFLSSTNINEGQIQNGIYAANYKLSILIILFTQAYRLGAEPILFKLFKKDKHSKQTYAKLLHIFVIVGSLVALCVVLFLHLWKYAIISEEHREYEQGLYVIPILIVANLILGIYFNLSIWFKVKNKTIYGLLIGLGAAIITVFGNYIFIPYFSYWASAWITLISYSFMAVTTYFFGLYYYRINYRLKSMFFYLSLLIGIILLKIYILDIHFDEFPWINTAVGFSILCLFLFIIKTKENIQLSRLFKVLKSN